MCDKTDTRDDDTSWVGHMGTICLDHVGFIHGIEEALYLDRRLDKYGKLNELDIKRLIKTTISLLKEVK